MDEVRILEIKQSVFKNNDEQADKLRRELKEKGVFLLNLMSSPGAGKTTTLKATIAALKDKVKIGVMEADIDSDVDAKRIAETGVKAFLFLTFAALFVSEKREKKESFFNWIGLKKIDNKNKKSTL